MYALYDTHNHRIVSRHRSPEAAIMAGRRLNDRLSGGSYLPTEVKKLVNGELVGLTECETEQSYDTCEQG